MSFTVEELHGRNVGTRRIARVYKVTGDGDDVAAHAALASEAPETIAGKIRTDIQVEDWGYDGSDRVYRGEVTWTDPNLPTAGQPELEVDESRFSFDTGGGTQTIYYSKDTKAVFVADGESQVDHNNQILVNSNRQPGSIEIPAARFDFEITHVFDEEDITEAYIGDVHMLTGCINADTFMGLPAQAVLFLGARGTSRGDGAYEITFRFSASRPVENKTVAGIDNVSAAGQDMIWVYYRKEGDDNVPVQVNVERVYDIGDFDDLNL